MPGLGSLAQKRFRRTFIVVYAFSALLPLLALIFFFYQYVLPALSPAEAETLRGPLTFVLAGMLVVPALGFYLMSRWIKSLENLTDEIRSKAAAIAPHAGDEAPENEMAALRLHFDSLYRDLHDKMQQLGEYSHRLIDTNIKLSEQAITDNLTMLYNRRYFDERLEEEISRSERHAFELSLIIMDVDGFKQYNDVLGHQAGDNVLRQIGKLIRTSVRRSDLPFRYGGDEFVVILPQCSAQDAVIIAKKLVMAVGAHDFGGETAQGVGPISISCGVSDNAVTGSELVATADRCLYKAKSAGKGRVVFTGKPSPKKPRDVRESTAE